MKRYLLQAGKPALALFGILIALLFCAFVSIYLIVTSPVQSVFYHDSKIQALQGAIFPRLTVVMTNKEWEKEVFSSPYVVALLRERRKRLIDILNCTPHPACMIQSWEISQHEREVFGEILQKLPKYLQLQYDEMQRNRDADAINYILSVYGEGHDPRYPKIDSASVNVTAKDFSNLIMGIQTKLLNESFQRNGLADPFF